MRIIIKAVMCLSFVTGTYEVVIETYNWEHQYRVGGDLRAMCWRKCDAADEMWNEAMVRAFVSEQQWQELMAKDIIECSIEMSMKEYFEKMKNL